MIDMIEFRKTLVRFAKIVDDKSWDDGTGSYRHTIFEYKNEKYLVRMRNGEILGIDKIK